jgi:hypothetical protein
MTPKFQAANRAAVLFAAVALVAVGFDAGAQTQTTPPKQAAKRQLDDLPGDRKFLDYAFPPPIGYPTFARENNNRPIDRQPLNPPSDVPPGPTKFPLY